MMKQTFGFALALILSIAALFPASSPAAGAAPGVPALPHAFYGTVTINGAAAAPGTVIEARGAGVLSGASVSGNPLTTTTAGAYGAQTGLAPKLIVQGDIAEGAVVSFFVNGVASGQTAQWRSGQLTRLDLSAAVVQIAPGMGAVPGAAPSNAPAASNAVPVPPAAAPALRPAPGASATGKPAAAVPSRTSATATPGATRSRPRRGPDWELISGLIVAVVGAAGMAVLLLGKRESDL